jgi:ssDNA-binding Zn-finger/Zn-ribbon topoisomerase 1
VGIKKTEHKKRQEQQGAALKPLCPKCGEFLKRLYTRGKVGGKLKYVEFEFMCSSSTCEYIIKNFIGLEDTDEEA